MSRGRAEDADVLEECASSSAVTPSTMQSHSSCSGPSSAEAASSSPFYSARIQGLSELRSKFDNQLEFDVESSKSHWTELSAATVDSDDSDVQVPNSVVFEMMKEHPEWGPFFRRHPYHLEIGAKIAEGGQAEIFEAFGRNKYDVRCANNEKTSLVLKVFKAGFPLVGLQRLWPPGIASAAVLHRYFERQNMLCSPDKLCWAVGAHLMDDGRFAFIFDRHWGDLRKLIDKNMLSNGCPPFKKDDTHRFMEHIAHGMVVLHNLGTLHNDLKAANVLVKDRGSNIGYGAVVADFESSVGIVGTGFWRAPEVLLALRNGNLTLETFTEATDVYSFAMTCYEIITGRMPFEGHDKHDYDIVLRGERPTLPGDPYSVFNDMVTACWHQDPSQRPSFKEIHVHLRAYTSSPNWFESDPQELKRSFKGGQRDDQGRDGIDVGMAVRQSEKEKEFTQEPKSKRIVNLARRIRWQLLGRRGVS